MNHFKFFCSRHSLSCDSISTLSQKLCLTSFSIVLKSQRTQWFSRFKNTSEKSLVVALTEHSTCFASSSPIVQLFFHLSHTFPKDSTEAGPLVTLKFPREGEASYHRQSSIATDYGMEIKKLFSSPVSLCVSNDKKYVRCTRNKHSGGAREEKGESAVNGGNRDDDIPSEIVHSFSVTEAQRDWWLCGIAESEAFISDVYSLDVEQSLFKRRTSRHRGTRPRSGKCTRNNWLLYKLSHVRLARKRIL